MALFLGIRQNTSHIDAQKVANTRNDFKLGPKKFGPDAECIPNCCSIVFDVASASFDGPRSRRMALRAGWPGPITLLPLRGGAAKTMRPRETPGGPNQKGRPGQRVFERGLSPRTDGEGGYPEGTEGLGFAMIMKQRANLSWRRRLCLGFINEFGRRVGGGLQQPTAR